MQIAVVPDLRHENMGRLQWPDETKSIKDSTYDLKDGVYGFYGFYNKTRATELARLCEKRTQENGELPLNTVWEFPEMGRLKD